MKLKIIITFALFLITFLSFYVLDKKLYFYGENILEYNILPFDIMPENRPEFEGGFVLWDNEEFSLVSKGNKYWNSDIEVNEILKYGYNQNKLIALVTDMRGRYSYIICQSDPNEKNEQSLKVIVSDVTAIKTTEQYIWVPITNSKQYISSLKMWRTICLMLSISIILTSIVMLIKRKQQ